MTKAVEAPHSKDNEMMVLGCALTSSNAIEQVCSLTPEDFYISEHTTIFSTLKDLVEKGKPTDIHLVAEELKSKEKLSEVGGVSYLTTLAQFAGTSAYIDEYVDLLKEKTALRRLLWLGKETEDAAVAGKSPSVILERLEKETRKILASSNRRIEEELEAEVKETVKSIVDQHIATFSRILSLGFPSLDDRLFLKAGDLVIAQGMSSHGKTKWMLQMLYNFLFHSSNTEKNPVCIFISYENSPISVKKQFLNLVSKKSKSGEKFISFNPRFQNNPKEGPFIYPDADGIQTSAAVYEKAKKSNSLFFLKRVNFEELRSYILSIQERRPNRPLVLFLDYFQIIPNNLRSEGWERVKDMAYGLEALAQELGIIIVAGSQVNAQRQAREGADIYNAATVVIDVFNHSVPYLKTHEGTSKLFKEKTSDGMAIISVSVFKNKELFQFDLPEGFLFDGDSFCEKGNTQNRGVQF